MGKQSSHANRLRETGFPPVTYANPSALYFARHPEQQNSGRKFNDLCKEDKLKVETQAVIDEWRKINAARNTQVIAWENANPELAAEEHKRKMAKKNPVVKNSLPVSTIDAAIKIIDGEGESQTVSLLRASFVKYKEEMIGVRRDLDGFEKKLRRMEDAQRGLVDNVVRLLKLKE